MLRPEMRPGTYAVAAHYLQEHTARQCQKWYAGLQACIDHNTLIGTHAPPACTQPACTPGAPHLRCPRLRCMLLHKRQHLLLRLC